jgi:polysaccharide deacetylase 2 family uncharacterized protein YibQ
MSSRERSRKPRAGGSRGAAGTTRAKNSKTGKSPAKKQKAGQSKAGGRKTAKKPAGADKSKSRSGSRQKRRAPAKRAGTPAAARAKSALYLGLFLLVLAAGLSGAALYAWLQKSPRPAAEASLPAAEKPVPMKRSSFEKGEGRVVPPGAESQRQAASAGSAPAAGKTEARPALPNERPLASIIIDDLGDDRAIAEKFFDLGAPLTCSILPHARHHREIAEAAFRRGFQVMLHLPMEPNEYPAVDPGPGCLLTAMTPDERIRQLRINLEAVPYAEGVNNHMGSKMTAMFDQMNQVFTVLKQQDLFFIDSRTTAATQCRSAARLFDVPFAERDVFLDHVKTRTAIRQKVEELVNAAEINGSAIAIGHPHRLTLEVLEEALPDLTRRVRLVPVSELVKVY